MDRFVTVHRADEPVYYHYLETTTTTTMPPGTMTAGFEAGTTRGARRAEPADVLTTRGE